MHVVLSLRDDFLMRTQEHVSLRPILTDLTALLPLSAEALRRALVDPAKKRGYVFEDDALVEEMVRIGGRGPGRAAAAGVCRGAALGRAGPRGQAPHSGGLRGDWGVAGALAKHAEEVMDRIGAHQDVVREIFRNMVTAQGTRAVVDRDDLLSAFQEKQAAEEVLRELVDGRLLTSYEVDGREGEPSHRRVEVVHESLLKAWPRLVGGRRKTRKARSCETSSSRPRDCGTRRVEPSILVWTGTAYQEFNLWRGRYQGALTALEEDFARSMGHKAKRRKRLLNVAVASAVVVLIGVAVAVAISLQQAARARDLAGARQATELFALGRARLEAERPNEAIAYAVASIEQSDNAAARRLAVEALAQGPPVLYLPSDVDTFSLTWSRDGRWFAYPKGFAPARTLWLVGRDTGERRQLSPRDERPVGFTADGERLVTRETPATAGPPIVRVWTLSDCRVERTLTPTEGIQHLPDQRRPVADLLARPIGQGAETVEASLAGRSRPGGSRPLADAGRFHQLSLRLDLHLVPLPSTWGPPRSAGPRRPIVTASRHRHPRSEEREDDREVGAGEVARQVRDRRQQRRGSALGRGLGPPRAHAQGPGHATQGVNSIPTSDSFVTGPPDSARPRSVFLLDLDAPRICPGLAVAGGLVVPERVEPSARTVRGSPRSTTARYRSGT